MLLLLSRVISLQNVQVFVTLLASHVLQNRSQFIVPGVEVWSLRGPNLGADKGRNVPPQPLPSRLGFGQELSPAGRPIPDH